LTGPVLLPNFPGANQFLLYMTHTEAQSRITALQPLLDRRYNGMDIDEVIAAPSDAADFALFSDRYMQTFDATFALEPFVGADLKLIAVLNRFHIREYGFFYQVDVETLRTAPDFPWPDTLDM